MSKLTGTADYESGSRMAQGQTATGVREAKGYTQQALGQIAPYQKVGTEALDLYRDIVLGGDMSKFYTSPSYQFRLGEGVKALEQGASARGDLLSGAQQKALLGYGQDLASQEYQNYLANVGGLATQGFGAGQVAGGYLQGTGQNILGAYGNLGQTQANLMAQKGQTKSNLFGELLSGAGLGIGYKLSDKRLKENIVYTGVKINGIDIVEFNYNKKSGLDTSKRYRGVIAQDVEKINPNAVLEECGYKQVDYSKIGINLEEI